MTRKEKFIWLEMARRKLQFHPTAAWHQIDLWGLFHWSDVKNLLKKGLLYTRGVKEEKVIWVRPSQIAWETHIEPILDSKTLDEIEKEQDDMIDEKK